MTTALEARPKLSSDLKIVRREHAGGVQYVVKQLEEDRYFQFGEVEVGLMRLMDGRHTPEEIAEACEEELGVRAGAGQVADFAHKLKRLGLVERTPAERHLMLMERLRAQRRVRVRGRTSGSLLRLRFSIGDPDRLFERMAGRLGWLWSRPFVAFSLFLFAAYLGIVVMRWDDFWGATVGLYTLTGFGPWDLALVYGLFVVIGGIHELGHGLTTKRFGGEVHEIGAMLLYFSPALFCNTNDAWTFERRADRLWVTFAGPWIQLVIGGLAAILWVLTEPGTLAHTVAFLAVLVGGLSAVAANFNPLLPLDGYYALSDWLEIPNLRRRAFDYWAWAGKRFLLGLDVPEPSVTPRERRVFRLYGGLALGYSALIAVVSLLWLVVVFGRFVGPWIWVLLGLVALSSLRHVRGRLRAVATAARTTWRAASRRRRAAGLALGTGLLALASLFLLPWTSRAPGEFVVEAAPRAHVRAPVDGIVDRVLVREGDTVRRGDLIAVLWNPELEDQILAREARADSLDLVRAGAEARGDFGAATAAAAASRTLREELEVLDARREALTLRSPLDGTVVAYRLPERRGERLAEGTLLAEIASLEGRVARVRLPLRRAEGVEPGRPASLKLVARPDLRFRSFVARVAPAADGSWIEAEVPFPRSSWEPAPGMVGIAKIETVPGTVARAVSRALRRTLRLDIDLWL